MNENVGTVKNAKSAKRSKFYRLRPQRTFGGRVGTASKVIAVQEAGSRGDWSTGRDQELHLHILAPTKVSMMKAHMRSRIIFVLHLTFEQHSKGVTQTKAKISKQPPLQSSVAFIAPNAI